MTKRQALSNDRVTLGIGVGCQFPMKTRTFIRYCSSYMLCVNNTVMRSVIR